MAYLPNEILVHIFTSLPWYSYYNIKRVCRQWRDVSPVVYPNRYHLLKTFNIDDAAQLITTTKVHKAIGHLMAGNKGITNPTGNVEYKIWGCTFSPYDVDGWWYFDGCGMTVIHSTESDTGVEVLHGPYGRVIESLAWLDDPLTEPALGKMMFVCVGIETVKISDCLPQNFVIEKGDSGIIELNFGKRSVTVGDFVRIILALKKVYGNILGVKEWKVSLTSMTNEGYELLFSVGSLGEAVSTSRVRGSATRRVNRGRSR